MFLEWRIFSFAEATGHFPVSNQESFSIITLVKRETAVSPTNQQSGLPIEVSGFDCICFHQELVSHPSVLVPSIPMGPLWCYKLLSQEKTDSVFLDNQGVTQSVWGSKGSGTGMWVFTAADRQFFDNGERLNKCKLSLSHLLSYSCLSSSV